MSDPIDIKALDEYLKGGSDISQRYRELGREDVPPELDRRVLDQARAAVASGVGGRSRSWLRWSAPVALAASVVLVVTVVIESGVQDDTSFATKAVDEVRPAAEEYKLQQAPASQPSSSQRQIVPEEPAASVLQDKPAPAPASPPPAALAKTEAERSSNAAPEETRVDARALREQSQAVSAASAQPPAIASQDAQFAAEPPTRTVAGSMAVSARKEVAPAAPEADSAAADVSEVAVTGSRVRRAPGRTAGPRSTVSGSSALSSERRPAADPDQPNAEQSNPQHSDPEVWLEEIRGLRRAGKVFEADRQWQRFREAFPDFRVADDDLARKQP